MSRAVAAAICKPPSDWKRPPGRPNCTWLRVTEVDLRPLNIGPSYTWKKKAASREHWMWLCSRRVCHEDREREREREKWAGWARHTGQLAKLRFHPEHRWNMHSNITQSRHFFSKATALTDHWQTDSWLTFVGRFPGMARTMREHDGLPVRSSWTLASTHQPCTDNSTDRTMGHLILSLKLKLQTKVRILIQPRGPVLNQTSD